MKLKLRPSDRMNRRYLLLETKHRDEVEKIILEYIGVLGWAKSSPLFIKTPNKNFLILSINRKSLEDIRAALEISGGKIKILKVSGTLRGVER